MLSKGENHTYTPEGLLCGIDGGGSITKIVVADLRGNVVFSFQTDSINHYGVGIEKAKKCFGAIADRLLGQLGCLPSVIFVGNSALSDLAEEAQVRLLTDGIFDKSTVVFHSDVYIALLAFTMGQAGAVLIAGTGSMACGIDIAGNYRTAGGWGQTLGDEGSGYYIGIEGMKAAIRAYEGMASPTLLTEKLLQYFHLQNWPDLIDKVYHPPIEKKEIAAFAIEVENAAFAGDQTAAKILEDAAHWLYRLALVITAKCQTKRLGYFGSVITHNQTIRSRLIQLLKPHEIDLVESPFTPEIGAIFGAFQEKGVVITDEIRANLSKYNPS